MRITGILYFKPKKKLDSVEKTIYYSDSLRRSPMKRYIFTLFWLLLFAAFFSCRGENENGGGSGSGNGVGTPTPKTPPPKTPLGFKAVASSGQIKLTWLGQADLTYNLFYSRISGFSLGSGTKIPDVNSPYEHTGLTGRTTYYYRLTAVKSSVESEPTDEVSATTPTSPPQGFMATTFRGQVTLTWDTKAELTYNLFYSTTQGFELESGMNMSNVTSPHLQKDLMTGTTYYYKLTANSSLAGESEPTDEISITPLPQVSAGGSHTCAVVDGSAKCWGDGAQGRLGHNERAGRTAPKTTPTQVDGLTSGVTYISAGLSAFTGPEGVKSHTCALVNGGAFCWGDNSFGQLGDDTKTQRNAPVQVHGLTTGVTEISVGGLHTCAVMNGRAFCWGDGNLGVLGRGNNSSSNTPVRVDNLTSGVTQISAGIAHTCAVMDGRAFCWGDGPPGKLGHNEGNGKGGKSRPTQVYGLTSRVTQISASAGSGQDVHTCAVMNGGAWCWGAGGQGQLGNGGDSNAVSPQEVRGLTSGVTQISAGGLHTCAVMNGGAWCWGAGGQGQLGNGGDSDAVSPQEVNGLTTGVTQISAGDNHTCAVVNGRVKCWGNSTNTRLGDGQLSGDGLMDRLTPTAVVGL